VIRNVARRHEDFRKRRQRERQPQPSVEPQVDDVSLAQVFDAAWAQSIMEQAAVRMTEHAHTSGDRALRRFDLLKLRFQEDMPIREIARLWDADPAHLHREYARARAEFREALVEVVAEHHPGARPQVEAEAARLITLF
jgi:RNA polymerase sigma-70 factor (ECF subfamily)